MKITIIININPVSMNYSPPFFHLYKAGILHIVSHQSHRRQNNSFSFSCLWILS